jgi:acyl-CoA dehydrogenase
MTRLLGARRKIALKSSASPCALVAEQRDQNERTMNTDAALGHSMGHADPPPIDSREALYPRSFDCCAQPGDAYLSEPAAAKLAAFFRAKGLAALKDEDRNEQWYQDWINYQAAHRLYASVLSPKQYSTLGFEFDLLRLTRFLEVFGYFSPAHGYSLQTTFLGLFAILMGTNADLKREAVAALEAGGLMGFGVSEKDHGADLLGNEFTVSEVGPGRFVASGRKYYIGNANCASIITILARKHAAGTTSKRAPFLLFALREGKALPYAAPEQSSGVRDLRKIRTLGVRAAYVGEFAVQDYNVAPGDFIAEGRDAWDAVFGTVTLGKFFLGFGSIGICEHALQEAIAHLSRRILYRKPALDMPHIRLAAAQAYARLAAMKLYAYRALDYLHAASADDRRYLLFCAVQKAKVSTEGVKVMAQLSECVGAKGFESDTYFESALRDIQLIPGLEGSTHINLAQTLQFMPRYFARSAADVPDPRSLTAGQTRSAENPYLMQARTGAVNDIAFAHVLRAYQPLAHVPNVRLFSRQVEACRLLIEDRLKAKMPDDSRLAMCYGHCMATIAYAQLIADNARLHNVASPMISAIFHLLIMDLSNAALALAALPGVDANMRRRARRAVATPRSSESDWAFVAERASNFGGRLESPHHLADSVNADGEVHGR